MKAPDAASGPLVAWLVREFEPQAAFGGLGVSRASRESSGATCIRVNGSTMVAIVVELPQLGNDPVARIAVVDV